MPNEHWDVVWIAKGQARDQAEADLQASSVQFEREHAAEMEVVRTALPSCFSRQPRAEAGKAGMAELHRVWRYVAGAEFSDRYRFEWLQAEGKAHVFGLVAFSPLNGVVLNATDGLPEEAFGDCFDFHAHFENGRRLQRRPKEGPVADESIPRSADEHRDQALGNIEAVIAEQLDKLGWKGLEERPAQRTVPWQLGDSTLKARVSAALRSSQALNLSPDAVRSDPKLVVLRRDLNFYEGCVLIRLVDQRGPRTRFTSFVLDEQQSCVWPLGTESQKIHDLNNALRAEGAERLRIGPDTVADYFRFFCEFTHADQGAFVVLESGEELNWLGEPNDQSTKQLLNDTLKPLQYWAKAEQTKDETKVIGLCRAFIGYGRFVFAAVLTVTHKGVVEMLDDEALHVQDLAIEPLQADEEFQFELKLGRMEVGHVEQR